MQNLYIRTVSKAPSSIASHITVADRRRAHIENIKKSLRNIPMISANITMNKKRISLSEQTKNLDDSDQETISTCEGMETPFVLPA
jgi:hypothetical protein